MEGTPTGKYVRKKSSVTNAELFLCNKIVYFNWVILLGLLLYLCLVIS